MENSISPPRILQPGSKAWKRRDLKRRLKKYWGLYVIFLPIAASFIIFSYVPMNGIIMSFQHYTPARGITGSEFVGLKNFKDFVTSFFFGRVVRNTFILNLYGNISSFLAPLILALLLNEVRGRVYKRTVQTVSYIPYFVSVVVVAGIVMILVRPNGVINQIAGLFGAKGTINFLTDPKYWRSILIITGIWTATGYQSIVYLATISTMGTEMYEAAMIDEASRWKQCLRLTLPGLYHVMTIFLIFNISGLLNSGLGMNLLLYNPANYETSDVIATYMYRVGLLGKNWSLGSAVNLMNSAVSMILLAGANAVAKRVGEYSLW